MTRPALPRRILAGALLLGTLPALGACSTLNLVGTGDPAATTATFATARPLDQVKSDVEIGKEQFRAQNYGLAETHFRKAVEASRGDAEAWLGLAASYDQLRRFDLADRAYAEALKITGPTPEFLNNRGYSYLMRGDVKRARKDLAEAAIKAPDDERIQNNLRALNTRGRRA